MLIKDISGLYEIKVDVSRRIVYQTHFKGMFTSEVLKRFDNDFRTKVIPLLKGKKWAKLCDVRNYVLGGDIVNEMNIHNQYCIDNGMTDVAMIVDSAIVKMQMNRAGRSVEVAPTAFTSTTEAEAWLVEKGYK